MLVRELLARRQVDACDLEGARRRGRPRRHLCGPPRRAGNDRRPKDLLVRTSSDSEGESRRGSDPTQRGSRCTPRRRPRRRGRLRRRRPLLFREAPSHMSAKRHRVQDPVDTGRATSSITSISRVTSRARQVGTVTCQSFRDLETEALEGGALLVGATPSPITNDARSGRRRTTGRSGSPSWTSTWPVIRAPARSTIIRLARTAAFSARYGSTPFSQRGTGCPGPKSLGRAEDPERLEVRRFRASTSFVPSETSLSSPPMIAASATECSPSVIMRSSGTSLRSVPSSVRSSSPRRARRTTIRPPASFERSKAWSGLPHTCMT